MDRARFFLFALISVLVVTGARGQTPPTQSQPPDTTRQTAPPPAAAPPAAATAPDLQYFAVEITVGTAWDTTKSTHEQAYFHEHSANLKHLRQEGALVMGARYSDKGFIVLKAATEDEAHAMMRADPAMQHGVFQYALYEFNVFYPGTLETKRK
jgi:uncharacterized protein YciI